MWRASKLTVLYGGSGVGKTSLLQAGVIPLLDAERVDLLPIGRVSAAVLSADQSRHNPYTFSFLGSVAPERQPEEIINLSILNFLRQREVKRDQYGDPLPILLAIDQAEEFIDQLAYRPDVAMRFLSELALSLRRNRETRLLLTVREDRLPAVLPFERALAGRSHSRFRLLPFGIPAAREAIENPLQGTPRRFEPGVVDELVGDLRTVRITNRLGETRPLLTGTVDPVQVQVVCSELWESLPARARIITSAHVRRYGNIDRFLATFCTRALSAVAHDHDISVARLRSWLQQVFITELGTRGTAYEGLGQTAGMPNAVVRALEDRHLIKAEHRGGTRWYELQHDRLIEPLQQAHPVELLEAAEMELADGGLALAGRHADQAIRTCGPGDLLILACADRLMGQVAQQRQDTREALRWYRLAASLFEVLDDTSSVAHLLAEAGRLSIALGQFAEAVTDLRAAADRAPGDLAVQHALASALWSAGQPLAAISVLRGLLDADRSFVAALRLRGEMLADMGKAEESLRDLEQVRRGQPASTLAARALAHAQNGMLEAADQEAADAAANASGHGPALFRAARVRELTGEHGLALDLAAAALAATGTPLPPHLRDAATQMLARAEVQPGPGPRQGATPTGTAGGHGPPG
jgi:tetratricopeptide (TPR) repeat protein